MIKEERKEGNEVFVSKHARDWKGADGACRAIEEPPRELACRAPLSLVQQLDV